MKNNFSALFLLLIAPKIFSQSLLHMGMAVTTNLPLDTSVDYVLHVNDTRNVIASAPVQVNWSQTTLLPAAAYQSQWKASRMGQVFGVTIDNVGNIYVAAGDVYYGYVNNGPVYSGTAGWGGIYKIDALNWSVTDFVTTVNAPSSNSTTQIPNTGVGLGNITYDKYNNQLFATNFEDGKIYRISMTGTILSKYDPATADLGTSGYVASGERVWAVAVNKDAAGLCRVYYSYWNQDESTSANSANTICSVPLDASGNFTGTEQLEITVPPVTAGGYSSPVASINFSSSGKMLLAERTMNGFGNVDAHQSNLFEYVNTTGTWVNAHSYNVGNYTYTNVEHTNSAGGADFAYADSDPSDSLNGCEELIWGTGDALRFSSYNPDGGLDYVYGLTGIQETGNSYVTTATNFVGTTSYFIDLDNDISTIPKTAIGSCAVFRNCHDTTAILPPPPPPPPPVIDTCDQFVCHMINVMTPNGDGVNDKFKIDCIQTDGWKLEVYDRWGTQVYISTSYHNDWDCGQLVEGVYYYILTSPCKDKKIATGFFHLIRK